MLVMSRVCLVKYFSGYDQSCQPFVCLGSSQPKEPANFGENVVNRAKFNLLWEKIVFLDMARIFSDLSPSMLFKSNKISNQCLFFISVNPILDSHF